jgi:DNA-binding MarR family transcriptional regulator
MAEKYTQEIIQEFESLIELISRTFHSSSDSYFHGLDMTFQQFVVMKIVGKDGCPKMSELAEKLGVTMGNMTSMIERLIKHQYVVRKDDPEDRRIVRVCLTSSGKDLMLKTTTIRRKKMANILSKITAEDRSALLKILEKLATAIKQEKGGKER